MGLSRPGQVPDATRQVPGEAPNGASVSVPVSVRAREDAGMLTLPVPREPDAGTVPVDAQRGDLKHSARPGALARTKGFAGQAATAGRAALSGSLWRARPASLRDVHARVQRADWAGTWRPLIAAGTAYGYAALVVVAVLYFLAEVVTWVALLARQGLLSLAEVAKRPTRLGVAAVVFLVPVLVTAAAAAVVVVV